MPLDVCASKPVTGIQPNMNVLEPSTHKGITLLSRTNDVRREDGPKQVTFLQHLNAQRNTTVMWWLRTAACMYPQSVTTRGGQKNPNEHMHAADLPV